MEENMAEFHTLPVVNENGYYEMRLESIGGLGANLCGKMLGELGALYLSLNSASFSSYGSEKRGSPVKAFIRWCGEEVPIRDNTPVKHPHILALFHEAMVSGHPVLEGIHENTAVVINTDKSPEQAQKAYSLQCGSIVCVDALKIAMESKSRINMVMLGAIVRASGFIPLDAVIRLTEDTIGKKYPAQLSGNLEGIRRGCEEAKILKGMSGEGGKHPKESNEPDKKADSRRQKSGSSKPWGYQTAPIGGVNPIFGSTVSNDLSPSRQGYFPRFIQERCINCGLCDSTCPDMVFQFVKGEYKGKEAMVNAGLDYYHCKGCLRCVAVCPTSALVKELERDYPEKEWFRRNKELIVDRMDYEKAGPNTWITSDSYLTEKRVDGGNV